ncbi:MAG: hypothetical protein M1285_05530 [Candidatus Thermoplasmatota archaeon]|jgi:hypothetical protein|nr:hypothetical protein [Candidatus Thermoplasmatota archaeon]
MEKHFCDKCGKEISQAHYLELWSATTDIQKHFDLTTTFRDRVGKYKIYEFCSEECMVDFTCASVDIAKIMLHNGGHDLKRMELVL